MLRQITRVWMGGACVEFRVDLQIGTPTDPHFDIQRWQGSCAEELRPMHRRSLIQIFLIIACLATLYAPIMKSLVHDWIHLPDFSHGFFIPIVSLCLVFERRKELSRLSPSGHWTGLGLMTLGILLLVLGNLSSESFSQRLSLLVVLSGIILCLLGKEFLHVLLFPLLYLIFMIPLPSILMDRIAFPMQLVSSKAAAWSLTVTGIPVLREGNVIKLAHTTLEVAEACSGIRSLISLLALAVILAYISQKKRWKQILLVLSTFPIAVIANAARVSGTAMLADYCGEEAAQGFFHGFSGWILFVVAFICLLTFGVLLSSIRR